MKHSSQAHSHSKKVESKTPLVIIGVFVLAVGAAAIIYFANSRTLDNNDTSSLAAFNKTKVIPTANSSDDTLYENNDALANSEVSSDSLNYAMPSDSMGATKVPTKYKNGTYKFTENYGTPGGNTSNKITIGFSKDKVSSVSITISTKDRESKQYQTSFKKAIKAAVVKKSIDSVNVSKVGGASLTTRAFMDAFNQAKSKAKR